MLEIDKRSEALSKYFALKTRLVGAAVFLAAITVFYLSPNVQVFDSNYSMLMSDVMLRGRTVDLSRVPLRIEGSDPRNLREGYPYHIIRAKGRRLYYMPWGGSILALPAVAAALAKMDPTEGARSGDTDDSYWSACTARCVICC